MVLVWQRCLLFVIVASLFGFAGCIGDDPAPEPDTQGTPEESGVPDTTATESLPPPSDKKVLDKVDAKQAVFAPTWEEGQWWTFDVSGYDRPAGSATLKVVELAEDHYKLGSDSDIELTYNMLNNGPFIPRTDAGIQFDSLAFYSADSYQDALGFRRPVGDTWDVAIHELKFKVTKDAVGEVDDPKGAAMGIEISGATPGGHTLQIVYSAEAQWFSTFRIIEPDGSDRIVYRLADYGDEGGPEVERWQRTGNFRLNAQSPAYMADAWTWESSGDGDQVVIAMHLRSGHPQGESHGSVWAPSGTEMATETVKSAAEWKYHFVSDEAGRWLAHARAIGGDGSDDRAKTDIFMMQIKRT